MDKHIQCKVPFVSAFTQENKYFRDCCTTDPRLISAPNTTFIEWWSSKELNEFRDKLKSDQLPSECYRCQIQEEVHGKSFRTEINKLDINVEELWPARWNIELGNKCNLSCWTCNEFSSSMIYEHKKNIGIVDHSLQPNQSLFTDELKGNILKSYDVHDIVHLTLLGGEPLVIDELYDFLGSLKSMNLNKRTILEIHTNGTVQPTKFVKLINKFNWRYLSLFVSIDAIGPLGEWVRYGSKWNKLEQNIFVLQKISNYLEIQSVVSILNIKALANLYAYFKKLKFAHNVAIIYEPWFMDIQHWDLDPNIICDRAELAQMGLEKYYDLIGSKKTVGCAEQLKNYINQFDNIRKPLSQFDPLLANVLGVN